MNAIKKYETITLIELKDGQALPTTQSVEDVAKMLNSSDFIVVGDVGFNRYEVKKFYLHNPNDIEQFVLSISDKNMRSKYEQIMRERKESGHPTNSVEHLQEIYNKRFG